MDLFDNGGLMRAAGPMVNTSGRVTRFHSREQIETLVRLASLLDELPAEVRK